MGTQKALILMAIKKEKSSNPNTNGKNIPKPEYEERIKLYEVYGKHIPDSFIDEIAVDLREWATKKTSLRFKDFLKERRLRSKIFYTFMERHEGLKQEYEWTLDSIASHREIGAMTRRLDQSALRMMPRYDQEWTENEEKLAKIKRLSQQEQSHGQTIIAVIPEVPHSNLVPERNDNDR